MRKIYLGIGFLLALCASPALQGQEIRGTSDTLSLNFGYPSLQAKDDLRLVDADENGQIDPGEGCAIVFTLANQSKYAAQDVYIKPSELNELPGLIMPSQVKVGNIPPEGTRRVEVAILAQDSLGNGTASFSFGVFEGKGESQTNTTIVYSVPVNLEVKAKEEGEEEAGKSEQAADEGSP